MTGFRAGLSEFRIPVGTRDFFFPERPDCLWDPPSLLFNFPGEGGWGGNRRCLNLATNLHLKQSFVIIRAINVCPCKPSSCRQGQVASS